MITKYNYSKWPCGSGYVRSPLISSLRFLVAAICLAMIIWLELCPATQAVRNANGSRWTRLPVIGRIGRSIVGVTTIEELENKFGPGLHFTGGHPHGGREWLSTTTSCTILADGFDYTQKGRVIDSFEICSGPRDPGVPETNVGRAYFASPGNIYIGMKREQVEKILKTHGIKYAYQSGTISCVAPGHVIVNPQMTYTTWSATYEFSEGKLVDINLQCY